MSDVVQGGTGRTRTICQGVVLSSSCDLVDVPPALEQRPPDAVHPRVGAVVRVVDVGDHLLRRPPVAGRERLVPGREDVLVRVGARVLPAPMSVRPQKGKSEEGRARDVLP